MIVTKLENDSSSVNITYNRFVFFKNCVIFYLSSNDYGLMSVKS